MLDELLKEIQELQGFKNKYEFSLIDKQKMSDKLYELQTEIYNSKTFEERKKMQIDLNCTCCRGKDYCDKSIIEYDVMMPIPSNCAWMPSIKCCKKFEWS